MRRIVKAASAALVCAQIAIGAPAVGSAAGGTAPAMTTPAMTTGRVHLSLTTGAVGGHVCVANRSADVAGAFALNAGLNVARVTDGAGAPLSFDGWYEPGIDGEARVYTVSAAPAILCVDYIGAFPVYPAHDAPTDFKGVMAFNGDSARFAEQAAWLPTPYDRTAKVRGDDTA